MEVQCWIYCSGVAVACSYTLKDEERKGAKKMESNYFYCLSTLKLSFAASGCYRFPHYRRELALWRAGDVVDRTPIFLAPI